MDPTSPKRQAKRTHVPGIAIEGHYGMMVNPRGANARDSAYAYTTSPPPNHVPPKPEPEPRKNLTYMSLTGISGVAEKMTASPSPLRIVGANGPSLSFGELYKGIAKERKIEEKDVGDLITVRESQMRELVREHNEMRERCKELERMLERAQKKR
ncbi:uncharacterized protein LY89DRAFT_734521 [Mollisia scopiformis]|uniref:Uncharacterized protein n=1 Tax=Mollisia scopiformis TaxID=149040 RepID=A0A194X8I5_MOLSC|nr:uncharacterized protein LY89DRAFT_734521 [Mollisia scopiformis]KUJ16424.1 hypothetical protein LY89DRAFT_734521 [Mollisia scopiformis]